MSFYEFVVHNKFLVIGWSIITFLTVLGLRFGAHGNYISNEIGVLIWMVISALCIVVYFREKGGDDDGHRDNKK